MSKIQVKCLRSKIYSNKNTLKIKVSRYIIVKGCIILLINSTIQNLHFSCCETTEVYTKNLGQSLDLFDVSNI